MSDETDVDPYYYSRDHDRGPGAWCVRGPGDFYMMKPNLDKNEAYIIGKVLSGKYTAAAVLLRTLAVRPPQWEDYPRQPASPRKVTLAAALAQMERFRFALQQCSSLAMTPMKDQACYSIIEQARAALAIEERVLSGLEGQHDG